MARIFAYCRVSTQTQTTENQIEEIRNAGFSIEPHRVISETISGSLEASKRPGWLKLIEKLEPHDIVVVTKLDRLGRSAIDVRTTVDSLEKAGIKVHCLALGGADLTSAAGRMTLQVIAAVAEFERDLLIERTQSGLERAKAQGKKLGRPQAKETNRLVQQLKTQHFSQSQVAEKLNLGIATVKRHWRTAM